MSTGPFFSGSPASGIRASSSTRTMWFWATRIWQPMRAGSATLPSGSQAAKDSGRGSEEGAQSFGVVSSPGPSTPAGGSGS